MRTLLIVTVLVSLTAGSAGAAALSIGDPAPMRDVEMKNALDGGTTTIAKARGEKGTLVVFWCNHCPFVIAWEKRAVALANEFARKGIGTIFVNANDPAVKAGDGYEGMTARVKAQGYEVPYVVDATSGVARAFGATRTPECFLFDAEWKLVYHGAVDDNARRPQGVSRTYLSDALSAVVSGAKPAVAETRAPGCTIKWRPVTEKTVSEDGPKPPAANRMRPDHAPTPYTAEEIRKGCPEGRTDTYRIEAAGRKPIRQIFRFRDPDAEGTTIEVISGPEQSYEGEKPMSSRGSWKGFQSHASFPEALTTIAEASVETPAGKFDCWLYTVTSKRDGKTTVTKLWFAKTLAGPPVVRTQHVDGEEVSRMTLLEHCMTEAGEKKPAR